MGAGFEEYRKKQLSKGLTQPNEIDLIAEYIDSRLAI
jgi:hypothetical protein